MPASIVAEKTGIMGLVQIDITPTLQLGKCEISDYTLNHH